jgi:hypothetical protein
MTADAPGNRAAGLAVEELDDQGGGASRRESAQWPRRALTKVAALPGEGEKVGPFKRTGIVLGPCDRRCTGVERDTSAVYWPILGGAAWPPSTRRRRTLVVKEFGSADSVEFEVPLRRGRPDGVRWHQMACCSTNQTPSKTICSLVLSACYAHFRRVGQC